MGLLDFDDEKILAGRKLPKNSKGSRKDPVDNFEELQLMDTKEQSFDFEDSPFADRVPKKEEEQV